MILLALGACAAIGLSLWVPSAYHCARLYEKATVAQMLETMEGGGPVELDNLISVIWCEKGLIETRDVLRALRELEREGRARCQPWRDPNAGREHLMPYSTPSKGSDTWTYIRR